VCRANVKDRELMPQRSVRQLKKAGYAAEPAFNGLEGLTKLRANNYLYDCVLMDLEMPSELRLQFKTSSLSLLIPAR
jgi:CheY-like chemotaxis protein